VKAVPAGDFAVGDLSRGDFSPGDDSGTRVLRGASLRLAMRLPLRSTRARALAAGGLSAAAVLAILAAATLPSASPGSRAAASAPLARAQQPLSRPQPHALVAVAERTLAAAAEAQSDPSIRRFTGRVGPDLSAALVAAGVPERQGRE
jgi:hypothetical protein